jgi:hypothetical protein
LPVSKPRTVPNLTFSNWAETLIGIGDGKYGS